MDISEAETGVMQLDPARVDLQRICGDAVELYEHVADERKIELQQLSSVQVMATVDPQRIAQAVANLLDNAIKYSDPGGRVTIGASTENFQAVVAVTDTGNGIDEAQLDKVWQRLYRADASRSRRGLGLGLSFVRAIVEAHGGSVQASSSVGKGSTFKIVLPASGPNVAT